MLRGVVATIVALCLVGCVAGEHDTSTRSLPIIGGSEAPSDVYPAVGGLISYHGYNCTGTLIAPDIVLTAGHCLGGSSALFFSLATNLADRQEDIRHNVLISHRYPGFPGVDVDEAGAVTKMHDIGIVILDEPIDSVTPERMLGFNEHFTVLPGDQAELVAYGLKQWYDRHAGVKLMGTVTIEDIGSHELQTQAGEFQPCNGDSGGPVFVDTPNGRRIVGVVSRAAGDGWQCDTGAIVTRTDPYDGWVQLAQRNRNASTYEQTKCAASIGGGSGSVWWLAAVALIILASRSGSRRD